MRPLGFKTIEEAEKILRPVEEAEAIKEAAKLLAPAEAYANWFKDSGRDQTLAEEQEVFEKQTIEAGAKIVESRLERKARCSEAYKRAHNLYYEALELKVYLRNYIDGLKLTHEARLTKERKITAQIKAGIYETGS